MTGTYKTIDNCEYEVFWHQPDTRKKAELMMRCTKSTVKEGISEAFKPLDGQIERNIKFGSWIKI